MDGKEVLPGQMRGTSIQRRRDKSSQKRGCDRCAKRSAALIYRDQQPVAVFYCQADLELTFGCRRFIVAYHE
jgi:hypothetical protein